MKTRLSIAALLTVLLVLVSAVALADVTVPALGDMPACPEVPAMTVQNDGSTLTATFSEPVSWAAGIWDWNFVSADFTDGSQTAFTLDVAANNDQFHCQLGFGKYKGMWLNDDGSVGGQYFGTYDMGIAFDVVLQDGTDVKYDGFGKPAQVTVNGGGTQLFGNGSASSTQYSYMCERDGLNRPVNYLSKVQETYADGSALLANYSMDGMVTRVSAIDPDGNVTVLYNWKSAVPETPEDPEEPEEPGEEDLVIFEGEQELKGISDWDGWADKTDNYSLVGADQLKKFSSGQSIKVTFQFPYDDWKDADWSNGPMLLIQPTDNWAWGQFNTSAADKAQGISVFSYDDIANSAVGALTADREFKYFAIYPMSQDITVTRIEIVD